MLNKDYLQRTLVGALAELTNADTQILEADGLDAILELLKTLRSVEFPAVILEGRSSGTIQLVEGPLDTFTQSVWVMGQLGRGEDEAALYSAMKKLAMKIVARFLLDLTEAPELEGFDYQRFTYMQRWGGNNARGWELMLTFRQNFSLQLTEEDLKDG